MPTWSDSGKNEKKGTGPFFLKKMPTYWKKYKKGEQVCMLSKKVTLLAMILKAKVSLRAKRGNLLEKKRAFSFFPNRRNKLKEFIK